MKITNKWEGRKLSTGGKVNKNIEPELQLLEISLVLLKPMQLH